MMKTIPNDFFFAWVEEEIAAGRSVRFRLKGQSMFPLLRNGRDEVNLYPCEAEELKPMDLVLFRYQGKHVLHRILRRKGENLLIRGDGSYYASEHCTVADVVGVVRQIIRPSGRVVDVDSWRWRFPSRPWLATGIFRRPLLRVLHLLMSPPVLSFRGTK